MSAARSLALLLSLTIACERASDAAGPAPQHLVYLVDTEAARALGWGCPEAQAEHARKKLQERLRRRRPELALDVRIDERGRVVVDPQGALDDAQLRSLDRLITTTGKLGFHLVAVSDDLAGEGSTLESERERFDRWREREPDSPVGCFQAVPRDAGGPSEALSWTAVRPASGSDRQPAAVALLREPSFDAFDLDRVFYAMDRIGFPAIGFEMHDAPAAAFEAFTGRNVERQLAIVVADEVVSAAVINSRLPGAGVIQGEFTEEEVRILLITLRSSSEGGVFRPMEPAPGKDRRSR